MIRVEIAFGNSVRHVQVSDYYTWSFLMAGWKLSEPSCSVQIVASFILQYDVCAGNSVSCKSVQGDGTGCCSTVSIIFSCLVSAGQSDKCWWHFVYHTDLQSLGWHNFPHTILWEEWTTCSTNCDTTAVFTSLFRIKILGTLAGAIYRVYTTLFLCEFEKSIIQETGWSAVTVCFIKVRVAACSGTTDIFCIHVTVKFYGWQASAFKTGFDWFHAWYW